MVYCINYDLRSPGRDYSALYQAIQDVSTGVWCHPLESVWFVQERLPVASTAEYLFKRMDSNDGLIVSAVAAGAAWYGLSPKASAYLKGML